ncbi:MAG: hypothetical protein WBM86_25725 [Waterburya sp.]
MYLIDTRNAIAPDFVLELMSASDRLETMIISCICDRQNIKNQTTAQTIKYFFSYTRRQSFKI